MFVRRAWAASASVMAPAVIMHLAGTAECAPGLLEPVKVVGGHGGIMSDGARLLKPLQSGKRGAAEAAFYVEVFRHRKQDAPPAVFMPLFYGIEAHGDGSAQVSFLALKDATKPFRRPSIMDIKMGTQAWDEDATPEKVEQERSKYPTQQVVGLRFTGMRTWCPSLAAHKEHGRAFGYALTEATLHHAFFEYLHDGERLRVELIPPLLERLRSIREWFQTQSDYRFYGSSLLFIFEGDTSAETALAQPAASVAAAAASPSPAVDVRMIDFAHVWPIRDKPHGRDEGYLLGLDSLIECLQRVQAEHEGGSGRSIAGTTDDTLD